jgi:hypothetical protein
MAELLHYLDKMEYRPAPKPRGKIVLKRRPDSTATTNPEDDLLLLDIIDKRPVAGFKRVIVKEFERILGVVQEKKKRREGEPIRGPSEIYVEQMQHNIEDLELPTSSQQDADELIELVSKPEKQEELTPEELSRDLEEEGEPKTPESKSRELDERLAQLEEEEKEEEKE